MSAISSIRMPSNRAALALMLLVVLLVAQAAFLGGCGTTRVDEHSSSTTDPYARTEPYARTYDSGNYESGSTYRPDGRYYDDGRTYDPGRTYDYGYGYDSQGRPVYPWRGTTNTVNDDYYHLKSYNKTYRPDGQMQR